MEKVHFSVAVVLQMQPLWISRGKGHLLTLPKGHCQLSVNIYNEFSPETTLQISFNFYTQPSGKSLKKVYIFGLGHNTKMAAMPICENAITS